MHAALGRRFFVLLDGHVGSFENLKAARTRTSLLHNDGLTHRNHSSTGCTPHSRRQCSKLTSLKRAANMNGARHSAQDQESQRL
jgi:hypothetical protein